MTHDELKRVALHREDVRAEYEALAPEFVRLRPVSADTLLRLTGLVALGGDALEDSEALYADTAQEAPRVSDQEAGLVDSVCCLNQFTTGRGNYTEERRAAIENQTLDEVLAAVYVYQTKSIAEHNDSHER